MAVLDTRKRPWRDTESLKDKRLVVAVGAGGILDATADASGKGPSAPNMDWIGA
jgi:hypothetical protein